MSAVVCHNEKFKASDVKGIQIHNQRESKNSKNYDIVPEKSHLNYDLHNAHPINYNHRVKEILAEGYKGESKIRKDAVVMNDIIISAETVFFENMSGEDVKDFFKTAYEHLKETYGEQNVVSAVVHMDEKSPHMHFAMVPLTKDGRLCAYELFDRNGLRKLQDEVPKTLQKKNFKIERGTPSSKKHVTTEEFKRKRMKQVIAENKQFESYAPCFDKIEKAIGSASKNLLSSKYSIEGENLKYLYGAARQGLGKNFNTDQRDQKISQLESSLKFYQTNYPVIEKKLNTVEKVLNSNPELKNQFEKQVERQAELHRQKQLQKNVKSPKKANTR